MLKILFMCSVSKVRKSVGSFQLAILKGKKQKALAILEGFRVFVF